MQTTDGWYRIQAPNFCAGLRIEAGIVTEAAPIVDYLTAWRSPWTLDRLTTYCRSLHWHLDRLIPDLTGVTSERIV